MDIKFSSMLGVILLLIFHTGTSHAAIIQIDPNDLTTNTELDFQFVTPGNINTIGEFWDSNGRFGTLAFGERFQGQNLRFADLAGDPIPPSLHEPVFDVLSGDPVGDYLRLVTGDEGQNLAVLFDSHANSNIITGLGPLGFDSVNGRGEGALAGVFVALPTFEFGFSVFGTNAVGSNRAVIDFFSYEGVRLDTIELSPLSDGPVAFRATLDGPGIGGFSIYNTDNGGLGYNNFRFNVFTPCLEVSEPASFVLFAIGLAGLSFARRLRAVGQPG